MGRLFAGLLSFILIVSYSTAHAQGTEQIPIWNEATGQGIYQVTLSNLDGAFLAFSRNDGGVGEHKAGFEFHFPGIEAHADKEKTLTFIIDGAATNYYFSKETYTDLGDARADAWYCPFVKSLRAGRSLRIVSRAVGVDQSFSLVGAAQKLKGMECSLSLCQCAVAAAAPQQGGQAGGRPAAPRQTARIPARQRPAQQQTARIPPRQRPAQQQAARLPPRQRPAQQQAARLPPRQRPAQQQAARIPPSQRPAQQQAARVPAQPPLPPPHVDTPTPTTLWVLVIRKSLGVRSAKELSGAVVCTVAGSQAATATQRYFRANGINVTYVFDNDITAAVTTYGQGRCDTVVVGDDLANKVANTMAEAGPHQILPERLR